MDVKVQKQYCGDVPYICSKLKWLHDRSEINGDNLNHTRLETSRHFRNIKKEYVKHKTDELATNSKKNKNIRDLYRGVNDCKGPSTILVLVLQPIHTTSKYTDPHAPKPGEQLK
jgi:hypothetical protein